MQTRRKGRKIYTYRVKNRRVFSQYHPMRTALTTVLAVIVLLFLGLVGYNVVGPLASRLKKEAKHPTTTPNPYIYAEATMTALETTTVQTTTTVLTTTEEYLEPINEPLQLSLYLNPNALSDLDKLRTVVSEAAANGYGSVVVPLKLGGGALQYNSTVPEAKQSGASADTLPTLSEIASTISACGVFPVARIETTADSLLPIVKAEAGYRTTAEDKLWLDDAEGSGGKPWISPFSDVSRSYLQQIAAEISNAGFQRIICGGVAYPNFYAADLEALGPMLSDEASRRSGLVGMLNAIGDTVPSAVYECDLSLAIDNQEEGLAPDQLSIGTACVMIDFHKFDGTFFYAAERYDVSKLAYEDKTLILMQIAEEITGAMNVLPCIRSDNLTEQQLQSVIDTMYEIGYSRILIQ